MVCSIYKDFGLFKPFYAYINREIMLPLAVVERLARKAGVERMSADAIRELTKTIEELGSDLALEAAQAARHAKRKTILREDIRLIANKS